MTMSIVSSIRSTGRANSTGPPGRLGSQDDDDSSDFQLSLAQSLETTKEIRVSRSTGDSRRRESGAGKKSDDGSATSTGLSGISAPSNDRTSTGDPTAESSASATDAASGPSRDVGGAVDVNAEKTSNHVASGTGNPAAPTAAISEASRGLHVNPAGVEGSRPDGTAQAVASASPDATSSDPVSAQAAAATSAGTPAFSATQHLLRLADLFNKGGSDDAAKKTGAATNTAIGEESGARSQSRSDNEKRATTADNAGAAEGAKRFANVDDSPRQAQAADSRDAGQTVTSPSATVVGNREPAGVQGTMSPPDGSGSTFGSDARAAFVSQYQGEIVTRVSDLLLARAQAGGDIRMTLEPKELGRLDVNLRVENGGMIAQIVADDKAVRDALMTQQHELRQALENQGVRLQEFTVFVRDEQHQGFRGFSGWTGEEQHGPGAASGGSVDGVDATSDRTTGRYVDSEALVDLVI